MQERKIQREDVERLDVSGAPTAQEFFGAILGELQTWPEIEAGKACGVRVDVQDKPVWAIFVSTGSQQGDEALIRSKIPGAGSALMYVPVEVALGNGTVLVLPEE